VAAGAPSEVFTASYNVGVPEERYEFDDGTYDRLDAAGVSALSVLRVLHGGAVVRRHIGAVLNVAGMDQRGRWLAVSLIESDLDDQYTVVGAVSWTPRRSTRCAG
jgi:hypothetical protein